MLAGCLSVFLSASGLNAVSGSMTGPSPSATEDRHVAFVGEWRLDLRKSRMGPDHPSSNYAFTKIFERKGSILVQKDHEVNAEIAGFEIPERNSTAELVPDSQEHTVQTQGFLPGMPSIPTQMTVEWQGDNLEVKESIQTFIGAINSSRRYFLSDDRTELIELVEQHAVYSDSEQRLVFTRIHD
jgi:hypothetical protein